MKARAKKLLLAVEEWDFRLCPEKERPTCLHYEYAREYVRAQPRLADKLSSRSRPSPYDHFLKFIFRDEAHPDNLPMLCPDFPFGPWLSLPQETRTLLIASCQLLPEKDASNFNLLVEDEFDVTYLHELDEYRKALFSQWMQDNRDLNDRVAVGLTNGNRDIELPAERHPLCNGPKRYYAITEDVALAVIQLDWRKSKRDLKAAFQRLLERGPQKGARLAKMPHKGGWGGMSDQPNKLDAKRLWSHHGSPEAAVEAIQLAYSKTRNKPPYSDADALRKAASEVGEIVSSFERSGRFRAFRDL